MPRLRRERTAPMYSPMSIARQDLALHAVVDPHRTALFDAAHGTRRLDVEVRGRGQREADLRSDPPLHRARRRRSRAARSAGRCSGCGGCASSAWPISRFPRPSTRASPTRSARWRSGRARSRRCARTRPDAFACERDFADQRRLLRASLLLHDVGHGPFSHACEAVLGVRHEQRTVAILAPPRDRAGRSAALDVDPAEVLALITGGRDALSGAARAGQRTEPRCRPHGLPAARRVLHRRRERALRRRAADRVAAHLRDRRPAGAGRRRPRRRRARELRAGALHDVRDDLLPPHDARVRTRSGRRAARALARSARARRRSTSSSPGTTSASSMRCARSTSMRRARCASA